MINLLPYDQNKQTRAARMNVIIFRYIIILGIAIGFLGLACAATFIFLSMEKTNNEEQMDRSKTAVVPASSFQGQANTFRSNLVIANNILDQQIIYSSVITGLGTVLPKGSIIDSLSMNDSTFGAIMDLKIYADSASLEPKIKAGFNSSTLFSSYQLVSSSGEAGHPGYPVVINISFTLNKVASR